MNSYHNGFDCLIQSNLIISLYKHFLIVIEDIPPLSQDQFAQLLDITFNNTEFNYTIVSMVEDVADINSQYSNLISLPHFQTWTEVYTMCVESQGSDFDE